MESLTKVTQSQATFADMLFYSQEGTEAERKAAVDVMQAYFNDESVSILKIRIVQKWFAKRH